MPISAPISHNSLTPNDILRLPKHANVSQSNGVAPELVQDTYDSQKSSAVKKTIFGLVVAAAVIVGLKHWGAESFMKVKDAANMKWYDHIKKGVNTLAEWIETPFVWVYNKCTGKAAEQATTPTPAS